MLAGEQNRLEKERQFRELEVLHKQLAFLLDRLNNYSTQATLVTGFAFTAFSADALQVLPYHESPFRAYVFCFFCALSMSCAITVVCIASYLMSRSERLAMNNSVVFAVAATRLRLPIVIGLYATSLVGLFGAACLLVFATCDTDDDGPCEGAGFMVAGVFGLVSMSGLVIMWRISRGFDEYAALSVRSGSEYANIDRLIEGGHQIPGQTDAGGSSRSGPVPPD
jgi:hypothetical protein